MNKKLFRHIEDYYFFDGSWHCRIGETGLTKFEPVQSFEQVARYGEQSIITATRSYTTGNIKKEKHETKLEQVLTCSNNSNSDVPLPFQKRDRATWQVVNCYAGNKFISCEGFSEIGRFEYCPEDEKFFFQVWRKSKRSKLIFRFIFSKNGKVTWMKYNDPRGKYEY